MKETHSEKQQMKTHKTKLCFLADTHYFSPSLSKGGRAYELRSGSDQKCLCETGGIIDAAFCDIQNSDADAVMIIGDLTNDGERICHEEFREKLYGLSEHKSVYVITATHDWCCDGNPRMFDGEAVYHDVDTVPPQELRDFYYDFGPRQAKSEFITHLGTCSFAVDIGDDVRLLALNDDQNGKGRAGFKEDHFRWIEQQAKQAIADGKILIAMEHHLITTHTNALITGGGTCVGDREYVASRLADAGIRYMFVGHSHLQRIASFTSESGNSITQINVGSLCGYPAPIVYAQIENAGIHITTETVESFVYNGVVYNTKSYLANHAFAMVDRILETANLSMLEFRDRLTALQLDGEKYESLYFLAKPVLKLISKATVKDVYRFVGHLPGANTVNKRHISMLEDKPLIDIIHEMMLSVFDGSTKRHDENSAYYGVVMGVFEMLAALIDCKLTADLKDTLHTILTGDEMDINDCYI